MGLISIDTMRLLRTYIHMQTVSELKSFRKHATQAGMSDEDIDALVSYLAANPEAGDEIEGTGGCRKVRFAVSGNNKGKSGGVRTITFYSGDMLPLYLITAFAKSKKVNLTKAERNELKKLTEILVQSYATRVLPIAAGEAT